MAELIGGRVHKFGDNINTDDINPAHSMELPMEQMKQFTMEGPDPDFANRVRPGDIVVAGKNFGSGSSRESAPLVLRECGVSAVIAEFFARIFYRNAINIGLPVLICPDAAKINHGDELAVDAQAGVICNRTREERYACTRLPAHILELVEDGGLIPHLEKTLAKYNQREREEKSAWQKS